MSGVALAGNGVAAEHVPMTMEQNEKLQSRLDDGGKAGELTVRRNEADRCYELVLDGRRIGRLDVRERDAADGEPAVARLPHTEVDPEFGGRGFGGRLVRFALDDLRARGRLVDPACPFVRSWIEHHPDYQDLVA